MRSPTQNIRLACRFAAVVITAFTASVLSALIPWAIGGTRITRSQTGYDASVGASWVVHRRNAQADCTIFPSSFLDNDRVASRPGWAVDPVAGDSVTTRAFGFPRYCLIRQVLTNGPASPGRRGAESWSIGLPLAAWWSGLIFNTAFYGVVWVLIGLAFSTARARARRQADRCSHCAYDRAGLPTGARCPECGRPP